MRRLAMLTMLLLPAAGTLAADAVLSKAIKRDYEARLGALFEHLHRHPELSFLEVKTAARMATELREAGFDVPATRKLLLDAISRVATNTARAHGVPENLLPEVKTVDLPVPPLLNDKKLIARLKAVWSEKLGAGVFGPAVERTDMGSEDFGNLTTDPYIPSVYFVVGGTPATLLEAEAAGGAAVPANHSPFFKIAPETAIKAGVETTTVALLDLMKK